jgi:glutathione-regulated potassium-efflux system ancillary protein KefC
MSVNLGLFVQAPLLVLGLAAAAVALKLALRYQIARWLGVCSRATPLLMALYARVIAPRLAMAPPREAVEERNPVLIAGFGRFGQVVTRVLNGLRIRATLIDHDQIEQVRRFGTKACYGDATRLEVLEKAGIGEARLLEVALDAAEAALRAPDFGPMAARRVVTRFRRHDEEALAEQAPHRGEVKKLIALQQQGREDLERLLKVESLGTAPERAATGASAG